MSDSRPDEEQDELLLRLRVEELERGIEEAWEQVATQGAVLDDVRRSRWWRAGAPVRRAQRALRPDVQAAVERETSLARIPLAGLHASTASGEPVRWREEVIVDEVPLPGLLADPPETIRYRVIPTPGLRLRAFAALRAAAWIGNEGGVRFTVAVLDTGGAEVRAASVDVDPAANAGQRRWVPLGLDLDGLSGDEHVIELRTELPAGASGAYAWAVWGDPVLLPGPSDPDAPASMASSLAREVRTLAERRLGREAPAASGPVEHPVVSLLVPVHDPDPALLDALLDSIRLQSSPHWQLCLCDDGSRDPVVRARLRAAADADERIVLTRHETARNIAAATNAALSLATGAFVAPVDHDDVLHPDAIADVGAVLAADPAVDMVYTDNDKVVPDGRRLAPSLKPDWSPELMRAVMYTLHLGVYRRALIEEIGGWRSEFDGAQDHDLVLRLSERTSRIAHVPHLRYSWRVHPGSAALSVQAKPEAYDRGCRAVGEHLERTGVAARAERLPHAGRYRVVHEPVDADAVDVILPLPEGIDPAVVPDAVRALGAVRVVTGPSTRAAGEAAAAAGATVVASGHDRWGALARSGIAATGAPFVVLLEELCVPETADWLSELCGLAAEPAIAAAGALVVDGDGGVVHAGVALPRGVPLPVHPGAATTGEGIAPELTFVTNRIAVSGAVAVRRACVAEDAGPDPRAEHHALTGLTLALTARAGRVVHTPHARLRVVGSPRGTVAGLAELRAIAAARGERRDPFWNPGLWADRAAHIAPAALTR
ncbi:MAG: glycosyltransferase [Solirubrobacteraceae bacterium]|nr:glycosyltransferase [Solirubrobacteraceae bacterium]